MEKNERTKKIKKKIKKEKKKEKDNLVRHFVNRFQKVKCSMSDAFQRVSSVGKSLLCMPGRGTFGL